MGFLSGFLLIVSLLNFWCLPPITPVRIDTTSVFKGDDVLLQISSQRISSGYFKWYKWLGERKHRMLAFLILRKEVRMRAPACGRMKMNYDGSLLIKEVTKNDAGIYTIVNHLNDSSKQIGLRQLKVYEPVRMPTLKGSKNTVKEDEDAVVFTCNTDAVYIQWFFNNVNLQPTERMKLSEDHRSLTIDPVKRRDAGYYRCAVFHSVRSIYSGPVELNVNID